MKVVRVVTKRGQVIMVGADVLIPARRLVGVREAGLCEMTTEDFLADPATQRAAEFCLGVG